MAGVTAIRQHGANTSFKELDLLRSLLRASEATRRYADNYRSLGRHPLFLRLRSPYYATFEEISSLRECVVPLLAHAKRKIVPQ
jgi:hypothetical protein